MALLEEIGDGTRASVPFMMPLGSKAFMPGKLVHPGECLVLLGADNYMVKTTTRDAVEILGRRKAALVAGEKMQHAKKEGSASNAAGDAQGGAAAAGQSLAARRREDDPDVAKRKADAMRLVRELATAVEDTVELRIPEEEDAELMRSASKRSVAAEPSEPLDWARIDALVAAEAREREANAAPAAPAAAAKKGVKFDVPEPAPAPSRPLAPTAAQQRAFTGRIVEAAAAPAVQQQVEDEDDEPPAKPVSRFKMSRMRRG